MRSPTSPAGSTWDATEAEPETAGILTSYLSGRPASASAGLREQARIDQAIPGVNGPPGTAGTLASPDQRRLGRCALLARLLGRPCARPGRGAARGHPASAGPHHLVGEHTADQFSGYMEGAVRSGQRAAREIVERSDSAGGPGRSYPTQTSRSPLQRFAKHLNRHDGAGAFPPQRRTRSRGPSISCAQAGNRRPCNRKLRGYQSIVPSVPTSATVCRSPIRPCSAIGKYRACAARRASDATWPSDQRGAGVLIRNRPLSPYGTSTSLPLAAELSSIS